MSQLDIAILRRIGLLIFTCCLLQPSVAQDLSPRYLHLRDSLEIELLDNPSPAEKADLLLEMAKVYTGFSTDSIRHYAIQAIDLGEKTGNFATVAQSRIMMGHASERDRDNPVALEQYQMALEGFEKVNDTAEIIFTGLLVANIHGNLLDSAGAFKQINAAMVMAKESGSLESLAEVYHRISIVLNSFGKQNESQAWQLKSLNTIRSIPEIERSRTTYNREAGLLNNIGSVYMGQAKFDSAANFYIASAELNEELENVLNLSFNYFNISLAYRMAKDPDKALEYLKKAEKIFLDFGDCYSLGNARYGIAALYRDKKDTVNFQKALRFSVETFENCHFKGAKGGIALAFMGTQYLEQGDTAKAFACYRRAEQHFAADPEGRTNSDFCLQFAQPNILTGNYAKAKQLLDQVAANLIQSPDPQKHQLYLDYSRQLYKAKGDYARSLEYTEKLSAVKDSINNAEILARTEAIQVKYDVAAKEQEILRQELEATQLEADLKQNSLRLRSWILGSIVVLLLASWVILLIYRKARIRKRELENARQRSIQRQKEEAIRQEALQRRVKELERQALQAQMNPHFIFNSLTALQGFIISGKNQEAEAYLHQFSRLIRNTLDASRQSRIPLTDIIENLNSYLKLERFRLGENLSFSFDTAEQLESDLIAIPPMLIQPFVENAIVHGISPKEGPGNLKIQFVEADEMLKVSIQDDGIGRQKRQAQQQESNYDFSSLGTRITRERLSLIWGNDAEHFTITDLVSPTGHATGTLVHLSIPILS